MLIMMVHVALSCSSFVHQRAKIYCDDAKYSYVSSSSDFFFCFAPIAGVVHLVSSFNIIDKILNLMKMVWFVSATNK